MRVLCFICHLFSPFPSRQSALLPPGSDRSGLLSRLENLQHFLHQERAAREALALKLSEEERKGAVLASQLEVRAAELKCHWNKTPSQPLVHTLYSPRAAHVKSLKPMPPLLFPFPEVANLHCPFPPLRQPHVK